ncbi:MAG: hypothetical protein EOL86_04315 [Deltaproteobacteria bacterium]|nr:hypothetical protein [Deltaproteobacteria bacterium]
MKPSTRTLLASLAAEDASRRARTIGLRELDELCRVSGLPVSEAARMAVDQDIIPSVLLKNLHAVSPVDQARLLAGAVLVVGAGGLGGYVLELLARFGVGRIRVADGDVFEESNLNRQLLSSVKDLGRNKARVGAARARTICPLIEVEALDFFLDVSNLPTALRGMDVVVDALGGIAPRRMLHEAASAAGLPVVSAAVAGWTALVGSEFPDQVGISSLWSDPGDADAEHVLGSLAPAACLAASLQAAEVVHYLVDGNLRLAGRMLHADLAAFRFELFDLAA